MNNSCPAPGNSRADTLLTALGLVSSRSRARDLIRRGQVRLPDGSLVDKPSRLLAADTVLRIDGGVPLVSRAGEKLAAFLDATGLVCEGCAILDIGASTGGFTDCLLRRGALRATCVDVGHRQLHADLAADPRVNSHEGVNARHLDRMTLVPALYDRVVVDVSFISLRHIWAPAWARVAPGGVIICLIKPQFEAAVAVMRKGKGILRDASARERVIDEVLGYIARTTPAARPIACADAAFPGEDGNLEAVAAWCKETAVALSVSRVTP